MQIVCGGGAVEISADVPLKGVALERRGGDEVVWEDNCVDVVPGEVVRIGAKGLVEGMSAESGALDVKFLNMMGMGYGE